MTTPEERYGSSEEEVSIRLDGEKSGARRIVSLLDADLAASRRLLSDLRVTGAGKPSRRGHRSRGGCRGRGRAVGRRWGIARRIEAGANQRRAELDKRLIDGWLTETQKTTTAGMGLAVAP